MAIRYVSGPIWALLFLSAVILCRAGASSKRGKPNIIFILADDMGWNDAGFHGGEIPTPNLDALAYQGIILNKHYTAPICTPSRAAFLTGKYPSNTGLQGPPPIGAGRPVALPLEEKILPQYLKEVGYATHLVGKWHLGSYLKDHLPTNRGFDSHFGYWNGYIGNYDGIHSTRENGPKGTDFHRDLGQAWNESYGRYITDVLTDEAVQLIRRHGSKSGLFLMLSHAAPHTGNPGPLLIQSPPRALDQERRKEIRDPKRKLYADILKVLDESVGRVVKELSNADMLSNSIIVFISDNGAPSVDPIYNFGNAGSNWPFRGEKVSAHEGGSRVLTLAWSPLFKGVPRIHSDLFHMVDWLPTFLTAAGGYTDHLGHIDGVDQWDALVTLLPPRRSHLLVDLTDETEAVIQGPWKLIKNYRRSSRFAPADDFTGASGRGLYPYNTSEVWTSMAGIAIRKIQHQVTPESSFANLRKAATIECALRSPVRCNPSRCLFDLETDPCESVDLASSRPDIVARLSRLVEAYRARERPKLNETDDPRADPVCWNNMWTTWLDPSIASQSTCFRTRQKVPFHYNYDLKTTTAH